MHGPRSLFKGASLFHFQLVCMCVVTFYSQHIGTKVYWTTCSLSNFWLLSSSLILLHLWREQILALVVECAHVLSYHFWDCKRYYNSLVSFSFHYGRQLLSPWHILFLQITSSLLSNLLDVVGEVQLAQIELRNLSKTSFHSSSGKIVLQRFLFVFSF